jgi:hypothetical protein
MKLTKKNPKFYQGIYIPKNKEKYKGNDYPRYMSSWELKLFRWCDDNDFVLEWSSENIVIPYFNPITSKTHNYIVDAVIKLKTSNGIKKFLVEVKPYKQTLEPDLKKPVKTKSQIYERLTFIKNKAKWEAAKLWCEKRNFEFCILTEHHLNINKKYK